MSSVLDIHRRAMDLAQDADIFRAQGDVARSRELVLEALPLEREAAERIPKTIEAEPTRSILYLSAASLAWLAKDWDLALVLADEGLSGYPPPRTDHDLRELIMQIKRAMTA